MLKGKIQRLCVTCYHGDEHFGYLTIIKRKLKSNYKLEKRKGQRTRQALPEWEGVLRVLCNPLALLLFIILQMPLKVG